VTLTAGTGYTVSAARSTATVAVADNDDPPTPEISVTAGSAVNEGGSASFTITASPKPASPLTVSFSVAQAGDFGVSTGTQTVAIPTSGSASVSVATTDDAADEPSGSVSVTLKTGTGYSVSAALSTAAVVVFDNDDPPTPTAEVEPELRITGGSGVTEGNAASFTITANPKPSAPITVTLAVAQTGAFGVATGTKTINIPTSGRKFYSVSTTDDGLDEADGSVTVTLKAGTGYTLAASKQATVRVADDDVPVISVNAGEAISEGGTASFTITADPALAAPLTVSLTVAQSGQFGAATGTKTVSVPTSGSISIAVATSDDSADEADGAIAVTIATSLRYTVSATQNKATVAVADNDVPVISISTAHSSVTEGSAISFTITASPAPASPLTVNLAVAQTGDYLQAGASAQTISIPIAGTYHYALKTVNDETDESDGSVSVTLKAGTGYTLASSQQASVAVADNDLPNTNLPALSISDAEGYEYYDCYFQDTDGACHPTTGFLLFTVKLSAAIKETARVRYVIQPATAQPNLDYSGSHGWVTIPAGATEQPLAIELWNDNAPEPTETLKVVLSQPTAATIADGEGIGTIRDGTWHDPVHIDGG
ncbi:MAG: hypothetical protein OXG47_07005, partial [bacterium]|nr:hypothetical protein [bacterium]